MIDRLLDVLALAVCLAGIALVYRALALHAGLAVFVFIGLVWLVSWAIVRICDRWPI